MNGDAMNIPRRLWVFGVIGLLLWGIAPLTSAQTNDSDDARPPRYRVEMVIFTQPSVEKADTATPSHQGALPSRGWAWPLREPNESGFGFIKHPEQTHKLAQAARRIDAQPGFTVHWHAAWEQPGHDENRAQAIALPQSLQALGLSGQVRVYLARFLHAEVDLALATEDEQVAWILRDSLRMRSATQHYLDHPAMGVLVRIDPIENNQD